MRRFPIVLLLVLFRFSLAADAEAERTPVMPFRTRSPVRLSSLIEEARQKNPELRAASLRGLAAQALVSPAGALDDPMLMVQLWNAPVDLSTVPVMVQLTQPIPLGGKRQARRDAASAEASGAQATAKAKARDVEAAIAKNYFDLFLAERTVDIQKEIEGTLHSLLAAASGRIAAGKGEESEALRAQAELLKVESDGEAASARRAAANARLVALLDRPAGTDIGTPLEPALIQQLPSEGELRELALRGRPELAVGRAAEMQAQAQVRLADAQTIPDIGVVLGEMHSFRMKGVSDFLFVGVQGNLPIFSASKNGPRLQATNAQLEAMRSDVKGTANKVISEVADAYAEVTAEKRQVELHHKLIPVARQALSSATGSYAAGRGSFPMVLDAERDLQVHQLDLATHLAMYEQRLAELERAVGTDLGLTKAAESGTREEH